MGVTAPALRAQAPPCWPVSGLAAFDFIAFPGALYRANTQWLRVMKREIAKLSIHEHPAAYRCGGSAGWRSTFCALLPASR